MVKEISNKKVRIIVNKYDPIGLLRMGCPLDEYEPEIKIIIPEIKKATSLSDMHKIVYKVFVQMFSRDIAGSIEKYRKLSAELYDLKSKKASVSASR